MAPEPKIDSKYEIILEDSKLLILSKSGNIPIHEGGLYKENCLTAILEKKYGKRLYPVYRLDRETSGIIVFAKKKEDVKKITDSITKKEYISICKGEVKKQVIDAPIGEVKGEYIKWKKGVTSAGVNSITEIISVERIGDYSMVKIIPKTGRQHQIRAHLQYIGHPIIGDKIYGESDKQFSDYLGGKKPKGLINRQALHLSKIKISGKEIKSELPEDMKELVLRLKNG